VDFGKFIDIVEDKVEIEYKDIPNFPVSTVEGHSGKLVVGRVAGKEVLVMSGRFHYYEGYSMQEVTFPIRVFSLLGIDKLIVTNAAGGIHPDFEVTDIMIIKDHIKIFDETPLRGKNTPEFGTRFPDMRNVYDLEMMNIVREAANEINMDIKEGVYYYMAGPQYETPAEVNVIKLLGGDAVGMSTVPEVIVCSHSGIKVLGLSCITNTLRDDTVDVTHEEVMESGDLIANSFSKLIVEFLRKI